MTRKEATSWKPNRLTRWRKAIGVTLLLAIGAGWWILRRPIDSRLVGVWSATRTDNANWTYGFEFRGDGTASISSRGPDSLGVNEWVWFVRGGRVYLDAPDRQSLMTQAIYRLRWYFQTRSVGTPAPFYGIESYDVRFISEDSISLRFAGSATKTSFDFDLKKDGGDLPKELPGTDASNLPETGPTSSPGLEQ